MCRRMGRQGGHGQEPIPVTTDEISGNPEQGEVDATGRCQANGAGGGTRTHKAAKPQDFKSCVYTIPPHQRRDDIWRLGSESNRRPRLCRPLHDHSAT